MCRDHPFCQRNKTTQRAVGERVGGDSGVGWGGGVEKGGREYREVFIKQGGQHPSPNYE